MHVYVTQIQMNSSTSHPSLLFSELPLFTNITRLYWVTNNANSTSTLRINHKFCLQNGCRACWCSDSAHVQMRNTKYWTFTYFNFRPSHVGPRTHTVRSKCSTGSHTLDTSFIIQPSNDKCCCRRFMSTHSHVSRCFMSHSRATSSWPQVWR